MLKMERKNLEIIDYVLHLRLKKYQSVARYVTGS